MAQKPMLWVFRFSRRFDLVSALQQHSSPLKTPCFCFDSISGFVECIWFHLPIAAVIIFVSWVSYYVHIVAKTLKQCKIYASLKSDNHQTTPKWELKLHSTTQCAFNCDCPHADFKFLFISQLAICNIYSPITLHLTFWSCSFQLPIWAFFESKQLLLFSNSCPSWLFVLFWPCSCFGALLQTPPDNDTFAQC